MERGKVSIIDLYGYDKNDGYLVINPEEAEVVRLIYHKEGYSFGKHRTGKAGIEMGCNSNLIGDRALIECVKYALKQLDILDDYFLESLYSDIMSSFEETDIVSIKPLQDKISRITEKKNKVLDWCLDGKIDEDEMKQMNEKYHKEIASIKSQIAEITERNSFIENAKENISTTLDAMRKIIVQEETTPELYAEIIDKVLLYKNHAIDIYFKHIYEPIRLEYKTSSRGIFYKVECSVRKAA